MNSVQVSPLLTEAPPTGLSETHSSVVDIEPERQASIPQRRSCPSPVQHPLQAIYWLFELLFGMVSMFALLAFLAAIPIVNFLTLGYLLEAEGNVARTGKLRNAMPLLSLAPRLGGIAAGTWFWWWAVRLVADAASDARLIAPGTKTANAWLIGLRIFAVVVSIHLILAIARGGRLGLFFWPTPLNALWLWKRVRQGDYFNSAGYAVREFARSLRLLYHFWLGLRGFVLAFAWLFIPTLLFSALRDTSKPGQVLVTLVGGTMLACVLSWIPFLQAHFTAQNRWRAMFELRTIRDLFRKAPIAMFVAVVLLYALSLPLYLFKIAALPKDVSWLLTPIFVVTIYPAKILVGWAYAEAIRRDQRTSVWIRWPSNLIMFGLLGVYVFILFFTPAIGAAGRAVLFQHHGMLLPWPF